MMNYFFILGSLFFLISLMSLISRIKHLLSLLMSIEMLILSAFLLIAVSTSFKNTEGTPLLTFLCLAVCEGTLGLTILISLSRQFGNTLINTTSLL